MRHLASALLLAVCFAGLATMTYAQERWWGEYPPQRVTMLVHHVHEDLNRGYGSGWNFNHHDRDRINHAERELHEFAERWNRGRFNKDELDEAIASIQHVVDNNHMSGMERDALWRDLDALRRMREAYDRHQIGRW